MNARTKQILEAERKQQQMGHRSRLCNRLIKASNDNLQDYEIVELMLFLIFKRKDTKPLAKTLLQKFGSIDKIISAPKGDLMKINGVGESTFKAIKIIEAVLNSVLKSRLQNRKILDCFEDVTNYCKYNMKSLTFEQLRIIFLNNMNEVIGDEVIQKGKLSDVNVDPREIVKKSIEVGASSLILVHNHPSGDPTPSVNDVYVTKKLKKAIEIFDIKLFDHIIIGNDRYVSFRNLLLLE